MLPASVRYRRWPLLLLSTAHDYYRRLPLALPVRWLLKVPTAETNLLLRRRRLPLVPTVCWLLDGYWMLSTAGCQCTFLMFASTVGNYCSFLLSLCTFVMCDSIVGVYCGYWGQIVKI